VKTALLQTDEVNDRDYFGLFPSAFVNYDLPKGQSLQVSYSRRIQRPRFWDLNPFFSFTDERNFFAGNPNLDPEYTDSYEVQYIKIWDSGNIGGSIYYRHTEDARQRIKEVDPTEGTSITIPVNLSTEDNIGLETLFSYSGVDWLRLDGNANFFRAQSRGEFNGQNFLTLTLSVRDLLNSRKRIYERFGPDFYEDGEFQWRARSASLTANYRINMKKQRGRRGGQGGGDGGGQF